jgi:hypothetical protein
LSARIHANFRTHGDTKAAIKYEQTNNCGTAKMMPSALQNGNDMRAWIAPSF